MRRVMLRGMSSIALLALLLAVMPVQPARAAGIIVNTAVDEDTNNGSCSLREAITAANNNAAYNGCAAGSGTDTITFAGDHTITLTLGSQLPAVTSAVIINGNGPARTIIQASTCNPVTLPDGCTPATYRVISVSSGGALTLDGMTMRHGVCTGSCATRGSNGGGILNDAGQLTLTEVSLEANLASAGGGMYSSNAATVIDHTTLSANSASNGGAIYASAYMSDDSLDVTNATFSGNTASGDGGALFAYASGLVLLGEPYPGVVSMDVTHSTFSGNGASNGGAMYLHTGGSTLGHVYSTLSGLILWGDSATTADPEVRGTPSATSNITYSVIEGGCASISGATCGAGILSTNPMLGILADNTGPTKTMALLAGSSAIDAGDAGTCPATDQRGITRPRGAACDIGAYEKIPYVPSDFDDDGITDPVKFDSTDSAWWLRSSDAAWDGEYLGAGTYVGRSDFDGDGKADPAKFDAGNSLWYVKSSNGAFTGQYIGPGTYTFVAGSDYEGDGKTDPAQFNTTVNSLWYYGSNDSAWHGIYLGPGTYQYVTGSDFDGDGKSDPAHFDSSSNVLWYMRSSDSVWIGVYTGPGTYQYVEASDFDGDGLTDAAQFTASSNTLWYVPSGGGGVVGVWMGGTPLSYVPAADFDGDGMTDPAGFDSVSHLIWYLPSGGGGWSTFDMLAGTYTIVN